MGIDATTEVNSTELAVILGLTSRRIRQLGQDGIIATNSPGRYPLPDSVQNYIRFMTKEKPMNKADEEKLTAEAGIKKGKAIITMLQAKELQGQMHRAEDVASMTEDLVYTIRSTLLALPGRLAVDAAAISDPAEMSELVRREVNSIMEELSQYKYDSKKYEKRVRDRMKWDEIDHKDDGDEEG